MCGRLFGSRKRGKGLTEERGLPGTPEWAQMAGHHVARYLFAVEFARGRRVLDCGTGFGYGARLLRTCGASSVVAVDLDAAVKRVRPDEWRGVRAREQVIKAALYGILGDATEVERIFLIVKAQREY